MKHLYFQSLIQFRVPVNDDGTIGNPEIIKKFTSPIKGAQDYNKPKQQEITLTSISSTEDSFEL